MYIISVRRIAVLCCAVPVAYNIWHHQINTSIVIVMHTQGSARMQVFCTREGREQRSRGGRWTWWITTRKARGGRERLNRTGGGLDVSTDGWRRPWHMPCHFNSTAPKTEVVDGAGHNKEHITQRGQDIHSHLH